MNVKQMLKLFMCACTVLFFMLFVQLDRAFRRVKMSVFGIICGILDEQTVAFPWFCLHFTVTLQVI